MALRMLMFTGADAQGRGVNVPIKLYDLGDGTWALPVVNADGSWSGGTLEGERTILLPGADENWDGTLVPVRVFDDPDSEAFILSVVAPDGSAVGSGGGGGGEVNLAPFVAPPTDGWTWLNQGTGIRTDEEDGILLEAPILNNTNVRGLMRTLPEPPYIATMAFCPIATFANSPSMGFILRDSVGGRLQSHAWTIATGLATYPLLLVGNYNSPTSYNANHLVWSPSVRGRIVWLQIEDDGVNRITRWSPDGLHWIAITSQSRTNWLTPDQIGFYAESVSAAWAAAAKLVHWVVE
jgi:hypothetical protein